MRLLFISFVIFNHTVNAFTSAMDANSLAYYALRNMRLVTHFTKMGFMFMSGLVLAMNYYENRNWPRFLKKRFNGSIWTYFIWTFILFALPLTLGIASLSGNFFIEYLGHLLHGDLHYLYYLLVTMQLYLIFPGIVWLFHRWPNDHKKILILSFIFQIGMTVIIKYKIWTMDTSQWPYWFHVYSINVITYQFYFVFGTYASQHYEALYGFVRQHIRAIATLFGGLALGTFSYYHLFNQEFLDLGATHARSSNQPYMVLFGTVGILFVFWIGKRYAAWRERGMPPLIERMFTNGAKISFGMYLDQIIGLLLLQWLLSLTPLSNWALLALLPIGWLFVVGFSFAIAWFFYKVPPLGFMIGRPQIRLAELKNWLTNVNRKKIANSDNEQ